MTVLAESDVWISGVQEYADSGDLDLPMAAQVDLTEYGKIGANGKEPLPMVGPLGAVRLLCMLRREPQYVKPFMETVVAGSVRLLDPGEDLARFNMRDSRVGLCDPLPLVHVRLPGKSERSTSLALHAKQGGESLSVKFTFKRKSSNALITIAAWSATIDYLASQWHREEMATPIGTGLKVLGLLWEAAGCPAGIGVREEIEYGAVVAEAVSTHTPDPSQPSVLVAEEEAGDDDPPYWQG